MRKCIFLLLFFERGYLPYYVHYMLETFGTYREHCYEGTLSQIFHTGPHSFFIKSRKNIQNNNQRVTRFFI